MRKGRGKGNVRVGYSTLISFLRGGLRLCFFPVILEGLLISLCPWCETGCRVLPVRLWIKILTKEFYLRSGASRDRRHCAEDNNSMTNNANR